MWEMEVYLSQFFINFTVKCLQLGIFFRLAVDRVFLAALLSFYAISTIRLYRRRG